MTVSDPFIAHRYSELRREGLTRRMIRDAVASGALRRVRRDKYVVADVPDDHVRAAEIGGRLDCVSLLSHLGVFVQERAGLHVQITTGSTRIPPPPRGVVRHWRRTRAREVDLAADLVEALAQACRCQEPRAAIATLDSAWHRGLVDEAGIAEVFARLPGRFGALRPFLDSRSESGPETLVRLLLRTFDCRVELQVTIDGVGRVDLLVDGWLIIECDSEAHHGGWDAQLRDRRRDLAAARLGYTTLRPSAIDIFHRRDIVAAAVRGLLLARTIRPGGHDSAHRSKNRRGTRCIAE